MSDHILVSPRHHTHDLHDVYASFMGYFERKGIAWYNHSYSTFFVSFDAFLSFGWGCLVVTDVKTGKGHVAVRAEGSNALNGHANESHAGVASGTGKEGGTVQQFARMIKVRFGESLPRLANQLPVIPAESNPRPIRLVSDLSSYKRLAATIPSAELAARRKRLRAGDVATVSTIWRSRLHSFLALELTWWEKGNGVVLEAGVCACRCRNIDAMESWPPIPQENYRRAHYVVSEWLDRRTNTNHHMPSQPRSYAHGPTQMVSMSALERILNATVSALASPETDIINPLVLLTIGDSSRLSDLKGVRIPSNVAVIDVSNYERSLLRASLAASSPDPSDIMHKEQQTLLSLRGLLKQLAVPTPPHIPISNSGNAAFYLMLVFQLLLDPKTPIPSVLLTPIQPQMSYPTMSIYPTMAPPHMPAANSQSINSRSNSPRRVNTYGLPSPDSTQLDTKTPRPVSYQPTGSSKPPGQYIKRSQTMYWDESPGVGLQASPSQQSLARYETRNSSQRPLSHHSQLQRTYSSDQMTQTLQRPRPLRNPSSQELVSRSGTESGSSKSKGEAWAATPQSSNKTSRSGADSGDGDLQSSNTGLQLSIAPELSSGQSADKVNGPAKPSLPKRASRFFLGSLGRKHSEN